MPIHKVTDFLSEISSFFKKDDSNNAMYTIMALEVIFKEEKDLLRLGKCQARNFT